MRAKDCKILHLSDNYNNYYGFSFFLYKVLVVYAGF